MRPIVVPLGLLCALVAGCGSGSEPAAGGSTAPSSSVPASWGGELVVELDRGTGRAPERYTLSCGDPVTGDLPDAVAACTHLRQLEDPFAPLPTQGRCTEQYGGPQTARVTGRWGGEPVDLRLSRTDGCRIAQWDSLGPLLPGPVG